MNIEKKSSLSLYPERVVDTVDVQIDHLERIENGEVEKIELTEQERNDLIRFEDGLGQRFEHIFDITTQKPSFYCEYFTTPEGWEDLARVADISTQDFHSVDDVKKALFLHRDLLRAVSPKDLQGLSSRSIKYYDDNVFRTLADSQDHEGGIDVANISNPHDVNILLTPEKALAKVGELLAFKKDVKEMTQMINAKNPDALGAAQLKIINLYKKRYNQMLSDRFFDTVALSHMAEVIGEENLSDEEQELLVMQPGFKNVEKNLARLDRFVHGADKDFSEGSRLHISQKLKDFTQEISEEFEQNELLRDQKIREKGLDPHKIFEKNVPIEQVSEWVNEILESYDQKSAQSAEDYDPMRSGPAPDGKWQFIARSAYRSMSVNGKQRIIKSGVENKNIYDTISVALGHEMGHFLQQLNSSQISLRLFQRVKGDRTSVFAEGGAMMIEDQVSQVAFGTRNIGHPHYLRAMEKKIDGGDYIACVKAFYDSGLRILQKKREQGQLNDEEFIQESQDHLKLSINRTKRLFRNGADFSSRSSLIATSKDTAYLEQMMVTRKLQEKGLEKYAFVAGVNLTNLATLVELGFLDPKNIQSPGQHAIEIWNAIKEHYT